MNHGILPRPLVVATAACLLAAAMPAPSNAEERGFYATLYGQASRLGSTGFDQSGGPGVGAGLNADFDIGYGFGGDIGWRYGNGWAAEVEWNYRRHGLGNLSQGANGNLATDGDFASNIFFVNGLRRFPTASGRWTLYVGAGLGWVQEIDFDIAANGGETSYSKSGAFGLQLIGGASWALSPDWSLTADLRWLRVGGVELSSEDAGGGRLARPAYNPLSAQIGIRRSF